MAPVTQTNKDQKEIPTMDNLIARVIEYLTTSGTLADCVRFTQALASGAVSDLAQFYASLIG